MTPSEKTPLSAARAAIGGGDFAGAAAALKTHLAAQPDDLKALTLLAQAQERLGAITDAAETLERLVALAPARVDAAGYRMLAKLKLFSGAPEGARAALTQAAVCFYSSEWAAASAWGPRTGAARWSSPCRRIRTSRRTRRCAAT